MGTNQTNKFMHSKELQKKKKRQPTENSFKLCTQHMLNIKNIQTTNMPQQQKKQTT